MSRASNLCQIDNCKKKRQKTTIFCKRHEKKVPDKILREIKRFFRKHSDGYPVIELDHLIKKANFSLKIDDYEKRFSHYLKKFKQTKEKQRVYIIAGLCSMPPDNSNYMWDALWDIGAELKISKSIRMITCSSEVLKEQIKNPCAVILLGEAGVRATMYPGRAENGIIHGGNQAATPEKCFDAVWKDRPSSPRSSYNYYYSAPTISCEPHPEEYDEFGKGEIREITKCLEWSKQFLYKGSNNE